MNEEECKDFKEFILIVEGKDYPIHAWLTHPEGVFTKLLVEPHEDHTNFQVYTHHDGKQFSELPHHTW